MRELPAITHIWLNVTERCNLACKYCFVKQQPLDMTFETAKKAVDMVAKNALEKKVTPELTFFGGEPLLRWNEVVKPVIDYVREHYGSFNMNITTNGLLLDDEKLDLLDDENVSILLSFDGCKETQDSQRVRHDGSGSYDDTLLIAKKLLKRHPTMTFRATISPWNADKLYENYCFARGLGYQNCFFIPDVFAEWSEEQLQALDDGLKEIAENYHGLQFPEFEKYATKKADHQCSGNGKDGQCSGTCGDPVMAKCGIGSNASLAVGPSGRFWTCQQMTESEDRFIVGDVDKGVDDAKRNAILDQIDLSKVRSSKEGACETCEVKDACSGGCLINNLWSNDDVTVQDYTLCYWYQAMRKNGGKLMGGVEQ